ncbi:ATP-binding cassette domain-containing protein [Helicobacter didelphidarum]|nr:ATP-binding cassette domain-containing protein [Helicobacter didelphidarum]
MTLAIKNITLMYQNTALLKNLSLEIQSGKITLLLGASGSGKSLSALAFAGLTPANTVQTDGCVLYNDSVIVPQNHRGRLFSHIMQNPRTCFNPLYTIKNHIRETLTAIGKTYDTQHVCNIFDEVGLDSEVLNFYSFELSGGMLQRVMIAIALLSESQFLIADEPTTDLDLLVQNKILTILLELQKKRNLGILFITHDLDIAIQIADYVVIINEGMIIKELDRDKSRKSKNLIKAEIIHAML